MSNKQVTYTFTSSNIAYIYIFYFNHLTLLLYEIHLQLF